MSDPVRWTDRFVIKKRERHPMDWAETVGNEGAALMLLAERRHDGAMARTALNQITEAVETMRNSGNASSAAFYEQQLSRARGVVASLPKP
jgi:hypothetical protein